MSTPDISALPANLQDIVKAAVADALRQQELAAAPKELTEHEKLLDHIARAARADAGEATAANSAAFRFHVLSALSFLTTELESAQNSSSTSSATVGAPAAATVQVEEGAL